MGPRRSTRTTVANLRASGIATYFRPRDAKRLGVPHAELRRHVMSGAAAKIARGVYRVTAAAPTEFESIAMVSAVIPRGVICLLSALQLHRIGTQAPPQVWVAIDRKARRPTRLRARIHFIRSTGTLLKEGVDKLRLLGVEVRVTSPARSVVDCFRYRNKIGIDVALEALRDVLRATLATRDELLRMAARCRARTVLRPYLEAFSG